MPTQRQRNTRKIIALLERLEPHERLLVISEVTQYFQQKESDPQKLIAAPIEPAALFTLFVSKLKEERYFHEVDKVGDGLEKISFDSENFDYRPDSNSNWGGLLGSRMFGNVPAIGCYAGGDWEWPVFFIVYLDTDGKTLRSYLPKSGNAWNYDTNEAFGNDEEKDAEFLAGWLKENKPNLEIDPGTLDPGGHDGGLMFDPEKILQDIAANVLVSD